MKHWKLSLLSAFTFLSVSSAVLVSSCTSNSCTQLKCLNGGTCAENFCRCKAGFDGAECEFKTVDRFLGTYTGTSRCSDYVTKNDTIWVTMHQEPNQVKVIRSLDKNSVYIGTTVDSRIVIDQVNNGGNIQNINGYIDQNTRKLEFYVEYYNVNDPNNKNVCSFYGYKK